MKIKHLKYNEIDFVKYDACIENAINTRIYAFSWYLDIVCNNDWEVLVFGNYESVMPLPFKRVKRKFFKRMIVQPMFCQQLGVFYLSELTDKIFQLFLDQLKTFKVNTYNFNAENSVFLKEKNNVTERVNYELSLNMSYEEIQNNYSKNLKRNIKKALKNNLEISTKITVTDFVFMKKENKKHKIKKKQYKLTVNIISKLVSKKLGKLYGVKNNNKVIAIAFIIQNEQRLIHLFSASTILGKKLGAIPYLFDSLIKQNVEKNTVFDFEGSMITGVANFFESFNSKNNAYFKMH